jgi:hypothetical protein
MTRSRTALVVAAIFLVTGSAAVRADVRADEKTKLEFAGLMGRMMNLFGGKAAREGVTSMVAVKGDRKATLNDSTGQIVDLAEEKIYDLDLKKKNYRVTTFAEIRRQMEEARKKAAEEMKKEQAKAETAPPPKEPPQENNLEIDFEVKKTGEKRIVNGFDTQQTLMIITLREKGKKLDESGGLVLTNDMWLTPSIPAMKEVAEFDLRYAKQLFGPMIAGASAEQMASAMALYPMLKPGMEKMGAELSKIEGTPVLTTLTADAVKSQAQLAEEEKQRQSENSSSTTSSVSGGVGGFLGGLAKKAAAKKVGAGGDDAGKPRVTFMTTTTEVLKVVTTVSPTDVAIPAGFKESK